MLTYDAYIHWTQSKYINVSDNSPILQRDSQLEFASKQC